MPEQPGFWTTVAAIVWKDLAVEWRSRQLLTSMLVFALLVILIFNFALDLDARDRAEISAGVLWATFAFAGTLGFSRSLAIETEGDALDALLLAPVDRSAIYIGKLAANVLFLAILQILTLPIYGLLYNINVFQPGLLVVMGLGAIGYTAIGTLLSAMSAQARTREMLLPVLLFPLALPLLISAVKASSGFLDGLAIESIWPSLNLLIAYDVIMLSLGYMFFDFVVEE